MERSRIKVVAARVIATFEFADRGEARSVFLPPGGRVVPRRCGAVARLSMLPVSASLCCTLLAPGASAEEASPCDGVRQLLQPGQGRGQESYSRSAGWRRAGVDGSAPGRWGGVVARDSGTDPRLRRAHLRVVAKFHRIQALPSRVALRPGARSADPSGTGRSSRQHAAQSPGNGAGD